MSQTRAERLADRLRNRQEGEAPPDPEGDSPPPVEPPQGLPEPVPASGPRMERGEAREKYQAYVKGTLKAEIQAAVFWTNNQPGGYASLTELTEAALERELEHLRERFNHGQPFQPMPPGKKLPTRPPQGRI